MSVDRRYERLPISGNARASASSHYGVGAFAREALAPGVLRAPIVEGYWTHEASHATHDERERPAFANERSQHG